MSAIIGRHCSRGMIVVFGKWPPASWRVAGSVFWHCAWQTIEGEVEVVDWFCDRHSNVSCNKWPQERMRWCGAPSGAVGSSEADSWEGPILLVMGDINVKVYRKGTVHVQCMLTGFDPQRKMKMVWGCSWTVVLWQLFSAAFLLPTYMISPNWKPHTHRACGEVREYACRTAYAVLAKQMMWRKSGPPSRRLCERPTFLPMVSVREEKETAYIHVTSA